MSKPALILCMTGMLGCLCAGATAQTLQKQKLTVSVGSNPSHIACADLNDDGWMDLVTADRGTLSDPRDERPANDEISILIHEGKQGDGNEFTFLKHQPSLKTGFAPFGIAIANIDALKWPDIVVVNFMAVRNEDLTLYRNLQHEGIYEAHSFEAPDGALQYHRHTDSEGRGFFTVPGLTSAAVRDINGDGLRDAVATAWSSDALLIFNGDASAYFAPPQILPAPGAPRDVQIRDLDGDDAPEFAVIYYAAGELGIWAQDKEIGWQETTRFATRGQLPVRLQCADLNGDNRDDLIVAHAHASDSIVVFYNSEESPFSVSQEILLDAHRDALEHEARDLTVGDFNGDGRQDLAVACFASSSVKVLLNRAGEAGALPDFHTEDYTFEEGRPRAVCAADFNQDGKSDLAVALWGRNAIGFLAGR